MIIDPDFLTHWRTQMLIDALDGDQMAPLYLIRIWAHCQQRKSSRHEGMPAAGLKALCKASCDAAKLERALIDAGFIARDGNAIDVPKWAEKNASLIAAWDNGSKGGRPPKAEPRNNPRVPEQKPTGNPDITQAKPIREEKRREEEKNPPTPLAGEFERFWRCYPKRKNRGQAEKAWSKLKPDLETVEAILKAVEVAKAGDDWHRDEGRFIPYPASWLNAKGWLDDPPEAQAPRDWWTAFGFATRDAAVRSGLTEPA